jgi:hypothetical protein
MRNLKIPLFLFYLGFAGAALAQPPGAVSKVSKTVVVKPKAFDEVLVNPGIGFTTFQRFNGAALNPGEDWTEGFPIKYQPYHGTLKNKDYPETSIAYFRIYWRFVEPEKGVYNWPMIDKALRTAHARHQTLMLRIAPYGTSAKKDVPAWYRQETGEKFHEAHGGWDATKGTWMVNPENPDYAKEFGAMIRALGARYDGDPDLYMVDISIVGPWGEGAGVDLLTKKTRRALLDSYLDSFHKTPLAIQLGDRKGARYAMTKARGGPGDSLAKKKRAASLGEKRPRIGWRADCLGDMGGFSKTWNHMTDFYPESIIEDGLQNAWKTAPVSMEACWVMQHWQDKGWDIPYIMAQAIKWHVSSFNAKSSAVPKNLWPEVNNWLKQMGYRYALRRFTYPSVVGPSRKLAFTSWWENHGDAPCYRKYPFAIRLSNGKRTAVMLTGADIRTWLPGDNLYNNSVFVPANLPDGEYTLSVAIVDPATRKPRIKLAIQGAGPEGWYPLGKIEVRQTLPVQASAASPPS